MGNLSGKVDHYKRFDRIIKKENFKEEPDYKKYKK